MDVILGGIITGLLSLFVLWLGKTIDAIREKRKGKKKVSKRRYSEMSFLNRDEKTTEELRREIQDECYAMAFGADIPEVLMEYEDARTGSDEEVKRIARRLGISLYK